ncbi:MAG: sulfatase/phosphatase domain-containing protein, partial [Planctomycetota bacterium]
GEVLDLLNELSLDNNTIIFLSGDNGGQSYFETDDRPHGFFAPNLNPSTGLRFRAGKGSLYEGGLKVPYLVRWPGHVRAGAVSDHLLCFQDVMPTLADLADAACPPTDGISFLPTLLDSRDQLEHDFLYWEFKNQLAVRMNQWKAYRNKNDPWELYDLSKDTEESNNISANHSGLLEQLVRHARESHQPIVPGEVFNREIIEKDRRQAPHQR